MKNRFLLVAFLLASLSTLQAQLRTPQQPSAGVPVFAQNDAGRSTLRNLLSKGNFKLSHSYEVSAGNFGYGQSGVLGQWTTNLNMRFSDKLDGDIAVGLIHTPFGGAKLGLNNGQNAKFFIENVQLNYRPKENTSLHLSFRQLPYQMPYGYYGNGYYPSNRW